MKLKNTVLSLGLAALCSTTAFAQTRDQIRIVGSSTVYPFTTTVAEAFGKTGFKTPVVESTGTGGGMKLFCEGIGLDKPDATNASRRIKLGEFELCAKNGVKDIIEMKIGFDGLTMAMGKKAVPLNLTRAQLFMALAKDVPDASGKLIANPYKLWSDIDKSLPSRKIEVMGPPPTSGTRDSLHELFMEPGAEVVLAALKTSDKKAFDVAWKTLRQDGAYIEAGEDDNILVQKLAADVNLVGIFGYSFLAENGGKIQGVKLEGIEPTIDAIADGKYKGAREMFVYVKTAHLPLVKGLEAFIAEYMSPRSAGEEGYLEKKGLVPLPKDDFAKVRAGVLAKTALTGEGLSK
jgi:phosphate transport system substrate-binding protein